MVMVLVVSEVMLIFMVVTMNEGDHTADDPKSSPA
jgi:hypothetical protein